MALPYDAESADETAAWEADEAFLNGESGTGFPALDRIMQCIDAGGHKAVITEFGACVGCGEFGDGPTWSKPCERCGDIVRRFRGEGDVSCPSCDAQYNAGGQRLRDDWRGNSSWYDDDIDDMEGFERQQLSYEREW